MGRHLRYVITQCYCHPTQVNVPRLTPARKAGTQLTYSKGLEGVDLGGVLRTNMFLPAHRQALVTV